MSEQALKISVITCTWNSETTLRDTIESVARQTHPAIEHVFVDGGSTDGTLQMIADLAPGAVVLNDIGGGISRAMNEGVVAATGDVIAHLHSDDYYLSPLVLETVAAAFEASPERTWAYGKIRVLKDGQLDSADYPLAPYSYGRYVSGKISIPHPAVFIRRNTFLQTGEFDTTLKYAMDIDYWLRLGRDNPPIQIDEALTAFREHPGSLSTANKVKAREEEWRVRQRYFANAPLAAAIYSMRYLRRMRRLRRELECPA